MPPAKTGNRVTSVMEDGRFHHKIRQSWMGTFIQCQEKARLGALPAEHPDAVGWVDSDASVTGSAVHQAIEDTINLQLQEGVHLDLWDVHDIFETSFDQLIVQHQVPGDDGLEWEDRDDEHQVVWVKRKKPETAKAFGLSCLSKWYNHTLPTLDPLATELAFGPLTLIDDDTRLVTVTGTIDYLDRTGPWDWKTSSRRYEPWEKDRWSVQRSVYCWALRQLAGGTAIEFINGPYFPAPQFTFCVLVDNSDPQPQLVTVDGSREWDAWLESQVRSFLPLMEAGPVDHWPRLDNSALCSPKWCEAWDQCKGKDIITPKWAQR